MAVTINASTSSGLQLTSDTSGAISFQKDGTNTLVLPTSGTITIPNGTGTVAVNGVSSNIVQATAVNSTSGTSIDFTGIPSWAKRITVMFYSVSTSNISPVIIQIGSSGGIETSGYISSASYIGAVTNSTTSTAFTTGFGIYHNSAADLRSGGITIANFSSNTWASWGVTSITNAASVQMCAGMKIISNTLDRVRITTVNGTDTFDAGSINIMYE